MCGIGGIYRFDRAAPVDRASLAAMGRSMRHRGPDDEGVFVRGNLGLVHQRLSIIDLSPAAHQPMVSPDGRFAIVFNGEIYNYLELRQDLIARGHRFSSHSDTEVVLRLYEEEGSSLVHRLNGMFAFAIWDDRDRTLFCARDHFGIKPFYYAVQGEAFAFASEIKGLFAAGMMAPRLSANGFADYVTFQFCLGDKTLFDGVRKLLPGHHLLVRSDGSITVSKYWDLKFDVDTFHTPEYFEHQLLRLLEDSVRLQLRSDVPVGAHLSGGLDSSTVACLAASLLESPLHVFTGGFREGPEYDETRYARIVAAKTRALHHEVFPTADEFVDLMPRLIYHLDEPVAGPGVFPQYCVARLAAQHVKVVLGGQGGDELFAGYTRYLIAYLEECIRGGIEGTYEQNKYVVTFESILPNLMQLDGYQPLLKRFWADGLFDAPERRYFHLIDRSGDVRAMLTPESLPTESEYDVFGAYHDVFNEGDMGSYVNRMTRFDLKTLLPALLQVEDRTSMAVSLESRVPLLDRRIAELVASMPPAVKYKGGRSKHIFRQVVEHLVPEEIFARKDKMGFPVPLSDWYRKGRVRDFVRDTLTSSHSASAGIIRRERIGELLDSEQPYGRGLWGLLSFELWMQTFFGADAGSAAAWQPEMADTASAGKGFES
jgi:asparagine synthase (glutamine-hydrolysing)